MSLTEKEFWDNYWASCKLPSAPNIDFSFDRCLAKEICSIFGNNGMTTNKLNILEIGCAPGKWLSYFAQTHGFIPSGIEYSTKGIELTKENMSILGLDYSEFYQGDFFEINPEPIYDVVYSFGFIEHFNNAYEILERHLLWLKPDGLLIIGVPNFNGVYKPIQKALKHEILENHNLSIMNLEWFKTVPGKMDVDLQFAKYIGSFEPSLPVSEPGIPSIQVFFVKSMLAVLSKVRKLRCFDKLNNKYISSYIIAVFRKNHCKLDT